MAQERQKATLLSLDPRSWGRWAVDMAKHVPAPGVVALTTLDLVTVCRYPSSLDARRVFAAAFWMLP